MSAKRWITAGAVVGGGCLAVLLALGTHAAPEGTTLPWSASSLGASVPWPAGFDPACMTALPRYSPAGECLAVPTDSGAPVVLDLAAGSVCNLYELNPPDEPNLQCSHVSWLTDERLWLFEQYVSEAERGMEPDWQFHGHQRYRVVEWPSGATVCERELTPGDPVRWLDAFGFEGEEYWIVRDESQPDEKRRFLLYDPISESVTRTLIECSPGESLRWVPRGAWIIKLLIPRSVSPGAGPTDLMLINDKTGETRTVQGVPPMIISPWGPQVTDDGHYLITVRYDNGRTIPIVIDTLTGSQRELPPGESWLPGTISTSRGVLLAQAANMHADGTCTTEWLEIPLTALLQE
jgi:hypothetical protein